jgi:predicted nucleotidyltransferase
MLKMDKKSRLRAFRNLPVGWVTHANHGRDTTERWFHWAVEAVLLAATVIVLRATGTDASAVIWSGLAIHSLWWVMNGNFHVYVLDSIRAICTRPKAEVADFVNKAAHLMADNDATRAVLVYGSACRNQFHRRSDLDLRVVRGGGSWLQITDLLLRAVRVRMWSLMKGIPTDLQVVDSYAFLDQQMRDDEYPIVAWHRPGDPPPKTGLSLQDFVAGTS